jgi:hypothetical protein
MTNPSLSWRGSARSEALAAPLPARSRRDRIAQD